MKKIMMILAAGLLVFSCATESVQARPKSKKKPAWLENRTSVYSESKFLSAIGEGDTLKEAQARASANLSSIFKVRVEAENTLQSRYEEYSRNGVVKSWGEETTAVDDITQTTDQTLMNLKYGETWTDDSGVVYTIAYLNRAETGNVYRQRIEENGGVVNRLVGRSAEQTDVLKAYAFLDAAYVVASLNELLIEQLDIINPAMKKVVRPGYDFGNLKKARSDAAARVVVAIDLESDSDGRIAAMLADVLTGMGFSVDPKGTIRLTGSVSVEPVKLDNNYENVKWYLLLMVRDQADLAVVSLEKNSRSSGVSDTAAIARAYKDMEKAIKRDFVKKLNGFFDSFIEK